MKKIVSTITSILLWVILGLFALAALAIIVVPRALGAVPLTVLTGSMEPTIRPGDLVVSRPVNPDELRVGNIVTFQPIAGDPTLFTHRIVDLTHNLHGETLTITTRGDANGADDDPIIPDQVMGRVIYRIPQIGYVTNRYGTGFQLGMIIGGALLIYAIITFIRPERKPGVDSNKIIPPDNRIT